jgi:hypothetical protein
MEQQNNTELDCFKGVSVSNVLVEGNKIVFTGCDENNKKIEITMKHDQFCCEVVEPAGLENIDNLYQNQIIEATLTLVPNSIVSLDLDGIDPKYHTSTMEYTIYSTWFVYIFKTPTASTTISWFAYHTRMTECVYTFGSNNTIEIKSRYI